jgi:uncharacterized glyoxalase superfamily protein PhnB
MTVRQLFPILSTNDVPALVAFYERALGAEVVFRFPGAEGDAYVSLALESASLGVAYDPQTPDAVASGDRIAVWFYVGDVDAAFAAALRSGATAVRPPTDMPWGERVGQVRDPAGHLVNLGAEQGPRTDA